MTPPRVNLFPEYRSWPEDAQVAFQERAAILEYDGFKHRYVAETEAFAEIRAAVKRGEFKRK